MSGNPFFSGRIPTTLHNAIENHRALTNESKTEVLINALSKYVGHQLKETENTDPPIHKQIQELFSRIEKIEKTIEKQKAPSQSIQTELFGNNGDNSMITSDNTVDKEIKLTKIVSTREAIKILKISQPTLSQWKNKRQLPKQSNGYKIEFDHSTKKPRNSYWKITKI